MRRFTYLLFSFMLFSPLVGYIYKVILDLPKSLLFVYAYLFFLFGIVYSIYRVKTVKPLFLIFLFVFSVYKLIWVIILGLDKHILTVIYDSILFFSVFFILFIVYNTHFTHSFIEKTIRIFKITIIIASIATLIQVFDQDFLNVKNYEEVPEKNEYPEDSIYLFRRFSIFGFVGTNAIGLAFLPMLSVVIGYMLKEKQKGFLLYLFLGAIVAFLSNSRYIMLGYILITIQLFVTGRFRLKNYLKYFLYVPVIAFILIFSLKEVGYNLQDWATQRLFHEGSIENTTRFGAITTFSVFFPQHPIFGTGYQTEEIREYSLKNYSSSHIHVGYLSHLVDYGIFGCFFLYGFWFLLLLQLLKTAKKTNYWGSFFGFLTFLLAFATMSQSSMLYYGLIFAFIFDKYYITNYRLNVKSECIQ